MKTTLISPENICPSCYRQLDAAADPEDSYVPKANDLTVCIYCQEILKFTDNMAIVKITEEDLKKLPINIQLKLKHFQRTAKKVITEVKFNNDNNAGIQDKP